MCTDAPVLTPRQIVEQLDRVVVGQRLAKEKLAHLLWYNQHRRHLVATGVDANTIPDKLHALFVGPSGVGKTLLVRSAAALLGVPFFQTSAPGYSAAGYVGLNWPTVYGGHDRPLAYQAIVGSARTARAPN